MSEENIIPNAEEVARAQNSIRNLIAALGEAIKQCEEHNSNYHHRTPLEKLEEWQHILTAVGGSPKKLINNLISFGEIDELCCEWGPPEYVATDDGEAWYWRFPGHDLPVADDLGELLLAARQLLAQRKT